MKKTHLSIGIPVFNEESNIESLITELFNQAHENYILDKVIVVCDGSTDNTFIILKQLSKKYLKLRVIHSPIRKGVRARIQQLININDSDILIFLDGDTMPKDINMLNNLVRVFNNKKVVFATAALLPIAPVTMFGNLLFSWRKIWDGITQTWEKGNNIYNFRGAGLAIKKDFSKKIQLPSNLTGATSHYIYLFAKSNMHKTAFCKDSVINYRLASSLKDYLLQLNRGGKDGKILKILFPKLYKKEYYIPRKAKFLSILKSFSLRPFSSTMGIIFFIIIPLLNKKSTQSDNRGIWKTANTTKIAINNV